MAKKYNSILYSNISTTIIFNQKTNLFPDLSPAISLTFIKTKKLIQSTKRIRKDFNSTRNPLKLSNFVIGTLLRNLIPIFITLFWKSDVLQILSGKSHFFLIFYSWIFTLCVKLPLCFLIQHNTSRINNEVTVRIL